MSDDVVGEADEPVEGTRGDDHPSRPRPLGVPRAFDLSSAEFRDNHPRRCAGHTRSGARCRSYAVDGMSVCRMHGGSSPQARRAAERRRAEAEATAVLERLWDPSAAPVVSPVESLLRLAGQMEHAVKVLGARLDVGDGDLTKPTAQAWWRVMSELRQALTGLERLDLERRHIELEQAKAELVSVALRAGLEALAHRITLLPEDRNVFVHTFLQSLGTAVPSRSPLRAIATEVEA